VHARLRVRRWGTAKAPILQGGWYPAKPYLEHTLELEVDGQKVPIADVVLEITEEPREKAVWGFDAKGAGAFVVCPAGHHIKEGVAPAQPTAWCFRCKHIYEIET
jgi:hypothetical protein